jgi:hypothetical protein
MLVTTAKHCVEELGFAVFVILIHSGTFETISDAKIIRQGRSILFAFLND